MKKRPHAVAFFVRQFQSKTEYRHPYHQSRWRGAGPGLGGGQELRHAGPQEPCDEVQVLHHLHHYH